MVQVTTAPGETWMSEGVKKSFRTVTDVVITLSSGPVLSSPQPASAITSATSVRVAPRLTWYGCTSSS
jgi:hypothetical protein